ncbi:glucosaminidase domain-containing protein [Listeria costaricensis]|uniref:glucosaminidase domain-containing protein n=1 Tax=Listeria costaricensis TaxID=2026604 RepID=UPI000C08063B|nr:glucosaminidase domain-containing protein [Listeria costaricensis]
MWQLAKKHLIKVGLFGFSISIIFVPVNVRAAETTSLTSEQASFINEIAPHAQKVEQENGILASITISQAILESDWGKSELATKGHNLFGIKGNYQGQSIHMTTREHSGDGWFETSADFRAYPSWYESLSDHAQLFIEGPTWNKNLYAGILGEKDYHKAAEALGQTGYSSDPYYAAKLIELIDNFDLARFDMPQNEKIHQSVRHAVGEVIEDAPIQIWSEPAGTTGAYEKAELSDAKGDKLAITAMAGVSGSTEKWYQIQLETGLTGWVHKSAVKQLYQIDETHPFTTTTSATNPKPAIGQMAVGQDSFKHPYVIGEHHTTDARMNKPISISLIVSL